MNDNETVEQVCSVIKRIAKGSEWCSADPDLHPTVRILHGKAAKVAIEFADRMLAAHKREMGALARQKTDENEEAILKNAELANAIVEKDERIERLNRIAESVGVMIKFLIDGPIPCGVCAVACPIVNELRKLPLKHVEVG